MCTTSSLLGVTCDIITSLSLSLSYMVCLTLLPHLQLHSATCDKLKHVALHKSAHVSRSWRAARTAQRHYFSARHNCQNDMFPSQDEDEWCPKDSNLEEGIRRSPEVRGGTPQFHGVTGRCSANGSGLTRDPSLFRHGPNAVAGQEVAGSRCCIDSAFGSTCVWICRRNASSSTRTTMSHCFVDRM